MIGKYCIRNILLLTYLFVGPVFYLSVFAQSSETIIVVPTKKGGAYKEFINSFESSLASSGGKDITVKIVESDSIDSKSFNKIYSKSRLIITVGTRATQKIINIDPPVPVLSTLIPRSSYRLIIKLDKGGNQGKRKRSSIFIDQPLARRMSLINTILPLRKTVSIVLGPSTRYMQNELRSLASENDIRIQIETMDKTQRLIGPLNRALEDSDVLLTVADAVVSNRRTVQNMLLTTYRQRVPVIAYSRAYVKAGALAAVYSTPEQIGRQAGELVGKMVGSGKKTLPSQQYPKYFSVEINHQVARSLGIKTMASARVEERLRASEGRRP